MAFYNDVRQIMAHTVIVVFTYDDLEGKQQHQSVLTLDAVIVQQGDITNQLTR